MYSESGRLHVIGVLTCAGLIVMTFTFSSCKACNSSFGCWYVHHFRQMKHQLQTMVTVTPESVYMIKSAAES